MAYAVITGDLIASRAASADAVDASMDALKNAANALGALHDFDPRFTRHRGDGWQIAMPLPGPLLDLPLALNAALRAAQTGLETRLAIGLGAVDALGTGDLSDAAGNAFNASGDTLERMTGHSRIALGGRLANSWMHAVTAMADWIAQGWTAGQAEAVLRALSAPGATNAAHAAALNISRQSFERRLRGSGLHAMEPARTAFLKAKALAR